MEGLTSMVTLQKQIENFDQYPEGVGDKLLWLIPNGNLPAELKQISMKFLTIGTDIVKSMGGYNMHPKCVDQVSVMLQHLIDAKDAAVRAALIADAVR